MVFGKVMRVYSQKIVIKNRVSKCPINLVSKTPFFEVLKFKYLQKHLAIFKKPAKTLPADVYRMFSPEMC